MADDVEIGELPDGLEDGPLRPDPPASVTDDPPDPDAQPDEAQLEDAARGQDPDQLELEQLATTIAPMYRDGIQLAIEGMGKQQQEFPRDRAERRAEQLARVLRRLGWDDEEILAYAGLATGIGTDLLWVQNLPDKPDPDDGDTDQEDDEGE